MEEIPRRKGQAVQIVNRRTRHNALRHLSRGDSHCGLLGFPFYDEIGMALKKFGHMCGGSSEEAYPHAMSFFGLLGPLDFVAVIDQRTEDKCYVTIDKLISCDPNLVPSILENGG